jgi:rhodanese-related sulfurtransferase
MIIGLGGVCLAAFALDRDLAREVVSVGVEWRFPEVVHLSIDAAQTRLGETPSPLLLDVRTTDEYAAGHLRGARWLDPEADPATRLAEVPRSRSVIVYCSVGWRSSLMIARLERAGFSTVVNLRGGAFAWVARGLPVVRGGEISHRVHPYGAPWSWLPPRDHRASP